MPSALNLPFQHLLLQSPAAGRAQASTGSSCKVFFCLHKQPNADAATVNDPNLWRLFPLLAQKDFLLYFEGNQEQWYILDSSGKTQAVQRKYLQTFWLQTTRDKQEGGSFFGPFFLGAEYEYNRISNCLTFRCSKRARKSIGSPLPKFF